MPYPVTVLTTGDKPSTPLTQPRHRVWFANGSVRTLSLLLWVGIAWLPVVEAQSLTEDAKLEALDRVTLNQFGSSVSLSGDRALVGALGDDDDVAGIDSGSAYVFERDAGGSWMQVAQLMASDAAAGDFFGVSVSLSGDRALVGALGDDDDVAGIDSGSAYVFERDAGGSWMQVDKLTALDAAADDFFGSSVSLSGDRALVGAWGDDDDVAGIDSGSAYVFERDAGGSWMQVDKLTALDAAADDFFGSSVSLSGDRALVGARLDDGVSGIDLGSAYVFERDAGGSWMQVAQLTGAAANDQVGSSVSLSGDRALVGAWGDDDSGSAYVFEQFAVGMWVEVTKLTALDAAAGDFFGSSVSLSGDRALVGAWGDDDDVAGIDSGSAYVFERDAGGSWMQVAKLAASDAAANAQFGTSVSLSGDRALVGARYGGLGGDLSGSTAYVFDLADTDGDGVPDGVDNCPVDYNPLQEDFDDDGMGDVCDPDDDGDGLSDEDEIAIGTNPFDSDTDDDGIPDGSDPDVLADVVAGLSLGVFANRGDPAGQRNAMLSRLEDIERNIEDGEIADAIRALRNLRRTVDGCGISADRNDWIVDCTAQIEVRNFIDLLITNLGG